MNRAAISFRHIVRPLIGISLLLAIIILVGPSEIFASWVHFETSWLLLAAIAITLSTCIGGFNLFMIINKNIDIEFKQFFPGYWLAWAVGLVIPGQVGDILGLTLWFQRRGIRWQTVSGIAIIDKLITLVWMLSFASCGLLLLFPGLDVGAYRYPVSAALGVVIGLLFLFKRQAFLNPLKKIINSFFFELKTTYSLAKKQIILNALITPLKISFIALAYWAVFKAAGVNSLSLGTTILLVAAASLVSYIPISFNGIGTVELTGIAIFSIYDIPAQTVLSVFIALRILVFTLAWAPSVLLLMFSTKPAN